MGKLPPGKFGPKSTAVIKPALFHDLPRRVSDQSGKPPQGTDDDVSRQMQQMRKILGEGPGSGFEVSAKQRHVEAQSAGHNAGAYDLLHGKYI